MSDDARPPHDEGRKRSLASFWTAFLLGGSLSLLAGAWGLKTLFAPRAGHVRQDRAALDEFIASLPPGDAVPDVESPRVAKSLHLFIAKPLGLKSGAAIDPLASPQLFSALFPGYPDSMRRDEGLWQDYFSREFGSKVASDRLGAAAPDGAAAFYSWIGCVDVFRRYGADVILLGASDTAQGVAPDLLAKLLRAGGVPALANARVLSCETPTMLPEVARDTAALLAGTGRRARWVVYGYSPGNSFTRAPEYDDILADKRATMLAYRENLTLGPLAAWDRPVVFPWTWNDLLPLRTDDSQVMLNLLQEDRAERSTRRAVKFDLRIPTEVAQSSQTLAAFTKGRRLPHPFLHDLADAGCGEFSDAARRLEDALEAMRGLGAATLLFVDPTTGLELSTAPACYARTERAMVARAPAAVVDAADAAEMGFDPTDFTYESPPESRRYWLNTTHVNKRGTEKLTRRVAADILRGEGR
ncbi:MAG: hypothetical protein HKL90_07840 [Elusimicrobia bacterium]|nr:hypothetical protein [Elusimicrobiota bacterium]